MPVKEKGDNENANNHNRNNKTTGEDRAKIKIGFLLHASLLGKGANDYSIDFIGDFQGHRRGFLRRQIQFLRRSAFRGPSG